LKAQGTRHKVQERLRVKGTRKTEDRRYKGQEIRMIQAILPRETSKKRWSKTVEKKKNLKGFWI